nr:hypothetical protein [Arthrobacter zhaoguopingii]
MREFAPVLAANGIGAISIVLFASVWFLAASNDAYWAARAAAWNITNAARLQLTDQNILVQAVMLGATDTDFTAGYDGLKIHPDWWQKPL